MMRRTAAWNRLLKGVAIALALVSFPVAPAIGQEATDAFDSQAAKGPDPRKELREEAALPGVDPDVVRSVVRPNMTLLADPGRSPAGNTVAIPPGNEQILIGEMRKELDDTKAELAKTKLLIGEVIQEYKRSSATPDLPPLPDAEVRVFQLKNTSADEAADKIKLLIGTQPIRIAIDEPSNGLIVFGKAEALPQVEQLVIKLDDLAVKGEGFSAAPASVFAPKEQPAQQRTLMLRVFWLANDVPGLDAPTEYLPPAVINSLAKLGLSSPQLVAQTVTSTLVEEGGALTPFSTDVPAVLFDQSKRMTLSGSLSATTDNRASVEMKLAITEFSGGMGGGSIVALPKLCELNGSLAAPIGHFMVLGTANSVIGGHSPGGRGGGKSMPMGRGMEGPAGMGMSRGAEGGRGMELRGSEQGVFTAETASSPDSARKLNSTRFAFVVQVVEAESFAPEE